MQNIYAVVLAAGRSKRFLGPTSKLLTPLCGRPVLLYCLQLLESLNLPKSFVLGHEAEKVQTLIEQHAQQPASFDLQTEQLGTGHAVACSQQSWQGSQILVLNADMPLVTPELIDKLVTSHVSTRATASFVAFEATDPGSYGRVIQSHDSVQIIEAKDCSDTEKQARLVNAGIYLFERKFLENYINKLENKNASREFYLTDLIGIASNQNLKINVIKAPEKILLGINTLEDFALVEKQLAKQDQKESTQTFCV